MKPEGAGRHRWVWHAVFLAIATAIALVLTPVTVVAVCAGLLAWLCGWPPRRLYVAALWCLPAVSVWLVALAAGWGPAFREHQGPAVAVISVLPAAVPLGLTAAALAWRWRNAAMAAGAAGRSPASSVAFDERQWRRQVRSARGRLAAPGAIPLLNSAGDVVTGATIRTVRHPARPAAAIPYQRLRSHQVVIGSTGTGKTTLLLRLWAGFMAEGLRRHQHPLLVVIDCKGGPGSRKVADRVRRVIRDAGARSAVVWPDDTGIWLWQLPAGQLTTTLVDLIEHGTQGAAYYRDVLEAIVSLAVQAPCGPPRDRAEFMDRLSKGWLEQAYAQLPGGLATVRSARKEMFDDVRLRFRTLWRRLGDGFEGRGTFADADAWYFILEGTAETSIAEAQARALVDLLAHYAAGAPGREILLAVDEFSAVSRRLPIWQLYERARALGLAVQVTSQSWEGLAQDADERYRIAATADGGIWVLRTPRPEPIADLAGSRRLTDTARALAGGARWADTGTSVLRPFAVLDPDLVRRLDVGQAAYVYRGGVTFVQVKRLIAGQAAIGAAGVIPVPAPRAAQTTPAPDPVQGLGPDPEREEYLDSVFGPLA
ncbi:MAG TPA: hypothetical protein VGG16_16410 [Streptosporangiaceae bacterium]